MAAEFIPCWPSRVTHIGFATHKEHQMQKVIAHLKSLFARTPWYAELGSAMTMFSWGLLALISPLDFTAWPSMNLLLRIGTENFWTCVGLCLGLGQFTFLLFDLRWCRWLMAMLACWFWSTITVGVFGAVGPAPSIVFSGGWILMNALPILHLLRNRG